MTEKELIKALKKRDRSAFNYLIEQYQNKVINIAFGILSNIEDANDASQDVFIKIYRNIDSFMEKSSLSTWIYRITANVCKDYLRKRMNVPNIISISNEETEETPLQIEDSSPKPDEKFESVQTTELMRIAIKKLSEDYKTVITLCDLQEMSYDDISQILKIPVGTVKSRLNRARKALKKIILENEELFF